MTPWRHAQLSSGISKTFEVLQKNSAPSLQVDNEQLSKIDPGKILVSSLFRWCCLSQVCLGVDEGWQ